MELDGVSFGCLHGGESLPLVAQPSGQMVDVVAWVEKNFDFLEQALMTSGVFFNPGWLAARRPGQSLSERALERRLLYYAEGIDGVVSVVDNGDQRLLDPVHQRGVIERQRCDAEADPQHQRDH